MSISIDTLEQGIDRLLSVCGGFRAENASLRARLVALEAENTALKSKIEQTAKRLEQFMEHLPAE